MHDKAVDTMSLPKQSSILTTLIAPEDRPAGPKARIPILKAKILPLGDSITDGARKEVVNGYRYDLVRALAGYTIDYVGSNSSGDYRLKDKEHQSIGGACIRGNPCNSQIMYPQTSSWIKTYQPDIVIMEGGTNDFCCGRENISESTVGQWMQEWIELVFASKPDVYVIVIGAPDEHPQYQQSIPKYIQQQATLGRHVYYVSFDNVSTYDRVDPDIVGYQTLANRIAAKLRPILYRLSTSGY